MAHGEAAPLLELQPEVIEGSVFHEDGSLNESFLLERYGLGIEEADQIVSFGSHTGTLAQMLADERCPVGGIISSAYHERDANGVAGGLAAVIAKFQGLAVLDAKFTVKISEATVQREILKKKMIPVSATASKP